MASRDDRRTAFLAAHLLAPYRAEPLPVDASPRRYFRIYSADQSLILMDADPQICDDLGPFVQIADHLRDAGLAAPRILAKGVADGFLLLEDLGQEHAARHLQRHPGAEATLYVATAETLASLQSTPPPPNLLSLTGQAGAKMLAPLFEWSGLDLPRGEIETCLAALIDRFPAATLSLRDLHAENIIWRPDLTGHARVGLVDFQDAWIAPSAYDLASLLDDPRRDVGPQAEIAVLSRFLALTGTDPEALAAERAVMSVQRNLRILGIFSRLIRRDSKPRYQAFLPRLRRHLDRQSRHPALARLRPMIGPVIEMPAK